MEIKMLHKLLISLIAITDFGDSDRAFFTRFFSS